MVEPTYVILRRCKARNDPDLKPRRRIMPGDYFAVIVNSKANYGNVPAITSVFDDSMAPCWGEVPLAYYYDSVKVEPGQCPPELIASLAKVEPKGPVIYRKRLTYRDRQAMWERS